MIKKLISISIILLTLISFTHANSVNVVLSNQNPDPVSPGNFVFVNVKVTNTDSVNTKNTVISFEDNSYFKLAQGEERTRDLGAIPQFSSLEGSSSFVIAKYKLFVEENTPLGLNTIRFNLRESGESLNYEFDILVQDSNPTLELVSSTLESTYLKAGESQPLTLTFENKNDINLRDVFVTLNLDNVDSQVFSTKKGSNQFFIDSIGPNEQKEITLNLVATPETDSKPYLLPITVEFEDSLGNSYQRDMVSSIQVFSEPELTLELDSQEIYTTGKGRYTISIANPSPTTAKGVELRLLSQDSYEVLDGSFQYVGDLDPDDFQTFQSDLYVFDLESELVVELSYLDAYNNKVEETRTLDLQLYSDSKLQELGLQGNSSSSGFSLVTVLIIVLIVGFIAYKVGGRQSAKKRR